MAYYVDMQQQDASVKLTQIQKFGKRAFDTECVSFTFTTFA
jgi:hypothetical protein